MSVPKKKRTLSSAKRRRSHHALKKQNLATCPKCKKPIAQHRACAFCGFYKGKEVIKVGNKKDKKVKEKKEKKK